VVLVQVGGKLVRATLADVERQSSQALRLSPSLPDPEGQLLPDQSTCCCCTGSGQLAHPYSLVRAGPSVWHLHVHARYST
jgi:transposase